MSNIKKIIGEYNAKVDLYKEYGAAVNNLLESLLRKGNYKYQLSFRLKSPESIKEKIKRKRLTGRTYECLNDMEDIIGIRIVFYTENERRNFIKDLTKAIKKTVRVKETSKVSGYNSTHAIVTFDRQRTHLDEYRKFKGLKCEVQMTPMLNHAWAEVEHDIFYKKDTSEMKASDQKNYLTLRQRMKKLMFDHIEKASLGLESIIRNTRRLETQK